MQNLENKRILIVGKETFMYPFYNLVDIWQNRNNKVAMFWINQNESEFDICELNASTYYEFHKKQGIVHYTLHDAVKEFTKFLKNQKLEENNLTKLEKKYSHFKNFNLQIISDQRFTAHYHYRDIYGATSYSQQMKWIQLVYDVVEKIMDDFKPDVIFDCDIAELPRTLLNEVAYSRGIPYISIAYSKYKMYKIPSYTLNLGVEGYIVKEYENCLKEDNAEEERYVKGFRIQSSIKNETYLVKGNPTYAYRAEPLVTTLKSIYGRWQYFRQQDKSMKNRIMKKQNPVLFVNSRKYMKFWIRIELFRRWLYKTKTLFENPVEGDKYIYMPLHLVPESSTYSISPFYINELSNIEAVSKSLPAGWWLYVKEHQSMLGERSMEFYKKVKKIPNVRLVQFNYYDDPKPWIEKAKAVVTITGTAAYEAVMLGKPVFLFGDVPYAFIKGVTRIREIEELPQMFQEIRDVDEIDNIRECAAYIKAVKHIGRSINLEGIMNKAFSHFTHGEELDEEFWKEIENLRLFFEDAYDHAGERIKQGVVRI